MPKRGMESVRRQQLIAATLSTIHESGFDRVTLSRVARRAGISPGLVPHYFRDKRGLLAATMRHIADELRHEVARHHAPASGPRERLAMTLNANFSPSTYTPELVSAWLAFWGQAHHDPELRRLQRVLRRRLTSNLVHDLRHLLPDADARRIGRGLSAFIDGLSLRHALGEVGLDRAAALAHAHEFLDTHLATAPARGEEDSDAHTS